MKRKHNSHGNDVRTKSDKTPETPKKGKRKQDEPSTSSPKSKRRRKDSERNDGKGKGRKGKDQRRSKNGKGDKDKQAAHPTHGKQPLKKRRVRHKTSGMRLKLAQIFERALAESPELPIIYHLFKTADASGTPRAPLISILRALQTSKMVKNTHYLSQEAWKSLNNVSTMFRIEEDEPGAGLFMKFRPVFDKKAATVYIDKLPDGCGKEKLKRLALCYGNVAEVTVPNKPPRYIRPAPRPPAPPPTEEKHENHNKTPKRGRKVEPVRVPEVVNPTVEGDPQKKPLVNVGSRPKSFGFVRFTSAEAAEAMYNDFKFNDPERIYNNCTVYDKYKEGRRTKASFSEFYLCKMMREVRLLRNPRRRRSMYQVLRLSRLRNRIQILWRNERHCWKRARRLRQGMRVDERPTRRWSKNYRHQEKRAAAHRARIKSMSEQDAAATAASSEDPHPSTSASASASTSTSVVSVSQQKKHETTPKKRKRQPETTAGAGTSSTTNTPVKSNRRNRRFKGKAKKLTGKKRKRRRKRPNRKAKDWIFGGQVREYFAEVQVLPMKKYEELAEEYKAKIETEKHNHFVGLW